MSTLYYIYAVIPGALTKELIANIMTKVDELKPVKMYHNLYESTTLIESKLVNTDEGISIAWQELLKQNKSEFIYKFNCLDKECDSYSSYKQMGIEHTEPAYLIFYKTSKGTHVDFSPEGLVPYRNTWEGIQIYYDWYISKLLKITEPYSLGELVACNDYFWDEHDLGSKKQEWKVEINSSLHSWVSGIYEKYKCADKRDEMSIRDIKELLLKLEEKCSSKRYQLIDFDIPELLEADMPFVLPIRVGWGMAKLIVGAKLSIVPFNEDEKPENLRPYIEVLFDLMEGEEIYYLEAFNSIDYHSK